MLKVPELGSTSFQLIDASLQLERVENVVARARSDLAAPLESIRCMIF